jgi:hypothetical protein
MAFLYQSIFIAWFVDPTDLYPFDFFAVECEEMV